MHALRFTMLLNTSLWRSNYFKPTRCIFLTADEKIDIFKAHKNTTYHRVTEWFRRQSHQGSAVTLTW